MKSEALKYEWSFHFLPQYSPQFAPVEHLFSSLKRNFLKAVGHQTLDLKNKKAMLYFEWALTRISKTEVLNGWKNFFKTLSEFLDQYLFVRIIFNFIGCKNIILFLYWKRGIVLFQKTFYKLLAPYSCGFK